MLVQDLLLGYVLKYYVIILCCLEFFFCLCNYLNKLMINKFFISLFFLYIEFVYSCNVKLNIVVSLEVYVLRFQEVRKEKNLNLNRDILIV